MNGNTRRLIEDAGFILWQNEEWSGGQIVDWSCNYDKEIHALVRLVADKCIALCENGSSTQMTSRGAAERIKQYFEVIK